MITLKKPKNINSFFKSLIEAFRFSLLISLSLVYRLIRWFLKLIRFELGQQKLEAFFDKVVDFVDPRQHGVIRRIELIDLSFRTLTIKKARSNVTIGGMAIGIAIVVFLVSIGYGLEHLVISRIATLDAIKQIDVTTQIGSRIRIDDKTLTTINNMNSVENVHPVIAAAGKINYQNSEADVAVYGVTRNYLDVSSINVVKGQLFTSNEIINQISTTSDNVQVSIGPVQESSDITASNNTTLTVTYSVDSTREIVVNRSLLKLLNIDESTAVGKEISMVTTIVGNLLEKQNTKIQTSSVKYRIIGVIDNQDEPIAYLPFIDLRSLGISYYSQARVVLINSSAINVVRPQIDGQGYSTSSVVDTIKQVTDLFGSVRIVLGSVGMVALFIASLGMFNTLTVSLLERTREIGLMKTMGMKSNEVKKLFLAESLVIGVLGGLFGLLFAYIAGTILSVIVSTFVIAKGAGFVNISIIPPEFVIVIVVLSFLVGTITGIFPARRATKISALDALRYE